MIIANTRFGSISAFHHYKGPFCYAVIQFRRGTKTRHLWLWRLIDANHHKQGVYIASGVKPLSRGWPKWAHALREKYARYCIA